MPFILLHFNLPPAPPPIPIPHQQRQLVLQCCRPINSKVDLPWKDQPTSQKPYVHFKRFYDHLVPLAHGINHQNACLCLASVDKRKHCMVALPSHCCFAIALLPPPSPAATSASALLSTHLGPGWPFSRPASVSPSLIVHPLRTSHTPHSLSK